MLLDFRDAWESRKSFMHRVLPDLTYKWGLKYYSRYTECLRANNIQMQCLILTSRSIFITSKVFCCFLNTEGKFIAMDTLHTSLTLIMLIDTVLSHLQIEEEGIRFLCYSSPSIKTIASVSYNSCTFKFLTDLYLARNKNSCVTQDTSHDCLYPLRF